MSIIVQNNQLNSNISISESPSIILDTESKGYYISSNLQTPTRDQTLSRSYLLNDVSNFSLIKFGFFMISNKKSLFVSIPSITNSSKARFILLNASFLFAPYAIILASIES